MNLRPSCPNPPYHHSHLGGRGRTVGLLQSHFSKTKKQWQSSQAIVKENVSNCRWLGTLNKTVWELRNWCGDTETQHDYTHEKIFLVTKYASLAVIFKFKATEQLLSLEVKKWIKEDKHLQVKDLIFFPPSSTLYCICEMYWSGRQVFPGLAVHWSQYCYGSLLPHLLGACGNGCLESVQQQLHVCWLLLGSSCL